ncbi:hypothetical protein J2X69_003155 [Algoriphagus sp. 4150]|nr:hypothetical protein [Algoriphagus sp. 4150]
MIKAASSATDAMVEFSHISLFILITGSMLTGLSKRVRTIRLTGSPDVWAAENSIDDDRLTQ